MKGVVAPLSHMLLWCAQKQLACIFPFCIIQYFLPLIYHHD